MSDTGKYMYCVVKSCSDKSFGTIGIGEEEPEVTTISYRDLAVVVSDHPVEDITINPENIIKHEKVIEHVMGEYESVLPLRFSTIAKNTLDVRDLLERRYEQFLDHLEYFRGKVEYALIVEYTSLEDILVQISENNEEIAAAKVMVNNGEDDKSEYSILVIGRLLEKALMEDKADYIDKILSVLRYSYVAYNINEQRCSDSVIMSIALLIQDGREKEMYQILDEIGEQYNGVIKLKCAGPFPPYNFIDFVIKPEFWEV